MMPLLLALATASAQTLAGVHQGKAMETFRGPSDGLGAGCVAVILDNGYGSPRQIAIDNASYIARFRLCPPSVRPDYNFELTAMMIASAPSTQTYATTNTDTTDKADYTTIVQAKETGGHEFPFNMPVFDPYVYVNSNLTLHADVDGDGKVGANDCFPHTPVSFSKDVPFDGTDHDCVPPYDDCMPTSAASALPDDVGYFAHRRPGADGTPYVLTSHVDFAQNPLLDDFTDLDFDASVVSAACPVGTLAATATCTTGNGAFDCYTNQANLSVSGWMCGASGQPLRMKLTWDDPLDGCAPVETWYGMGSVHHP